MKKCPECHNQVSRRAEKCPFCARPLKPLTFFRLAKYFILLVIGIPVAMVIWEEADPAKSQQTTPEDYAISVAQAFVRSELKSPSTAKFGRISEHRKIRIEGKENAFKIYGHVDAQNAFGASIRSSYVCEIQYIDNDWLLINLDFY